MACATLLDALYRDRELLPLIVSRIPEDIQHVAREITTTLYIIEMVIKAPTDIEQPINKMVELSASAEDGTCLLSRIITCLMSQPAGGTVDVRSLLLAPNFPGEDARMYLAVR
jgi:hypothetical protein